ncbi:XdhC family protein [Streptomyces huiliensis]|uniref:XdhC family protein n=1 Tax=Streptomyces huiliensis TaxID=2876027 RepID=UPI001CBADF82|nr:XdhC/CoxI family protein [Streptomyces huiliensis]MBZ4323573.1 XdhC family protein [Streptomyces huiliensis]
MLDLAPELSRWCAEGREFAVATVVATRGSAPRGPGAALAVAADGTAAGSVSGGCVEAAVHELCRRALATGESLLERFAGDPDDPFAIGLTCGGTLDVLVTPVRAGSPAASALTAAARGEAVALVRALGGLTGPGLLVRPGGLPEGTLGGGAILDSAAVDAARALLDAGRSAAVDVGAVTVWVESTAPPPRMIVFGAIDYAAALVRVGSFLGHHVTVCDARPVFATEERFPDADEVVVDWPHRYLDSQRLDPRAVLCVLTHDARFDVPLLVRALRLPVAYVGAMGSHRTHRERLRRLRAAGVSEAELSRLRSPIGLDLGARSPEETAVSIAAEIVAHRHGGSGVPLTGSEAPIHRGVGMRRVVRVGCPSPAPSPFPGAAPQTP